MSLIAWFLSNPHFHLLQGRQLYFYMSRLVTKMTVRLAKTQISLGIRPVWSESSLYTHCVAKDPNFLHADTEDWSDRLSSLGAHAILLILSRGGSYAYLWWNY